MKPIGKWRHWITPKTPSKPTSHAPVPAKDKRALIVEFAHWGCAHEPGIHYAETRPIPQVKQGQLPRGPFTTDCSGFVTMAYQYAGAPDPNGNHYNGQGYTGTILKTGTKTTAAKLRPGDLIVYGTDKYPSGHHVVVVVSVGSKGVMTASHGQEKGPFLITVSEEAKYQPPGIVYLTYELE